MLVLLVRTDRVQALRAEDANNAAKDVRLFKIQVNEFGGLIFDELDRPCDVNWL